MAASGISPPGTGTKGTSRSDWGAQASTAVLVLTIAVLGVGGAAAATYAHDHGISLAVAILGIVGAYLAGAAVVAAVAVYVHRTACARLASRQPPEPRSPGWR